MIGGGGGGEGASVGRAPGFAGLQPAAGLALAENTLLPGARAGEKARDAWRLAGGLTKVRSTYTTRIRETSGRAAALDQVRLVAVDHPVELKPYRLGDGFVLGTRQAAVHVAAADGTDLTAVLAVGGSHAPAPGETLSVDLGPEGGASPLVIEASGVWPCGLKILAPDGKGGWESAGRLTPRKSSDELILAASGSQVLRLVVMGGVSLQFVGSLAVAEQAPTTQTASLLSAEGTRLGDVSAAVGSADDVSATLAGPDTLALAFEVPPLAEGAVRDLFLLVEGTSVTPRTLARMQPAAEPQLLPARFALRQNQPNPFNAATTIRFDLPVGAMVRLEIFDIQGRRVKVLADHFYPAGYQAVQWDRRTGAGGAVRPGVYLYRLIAGSLRAQKKMVLLP
jgi:hypothetical protein